MIDKPEMDELIASLEPFKDIFRQLSIEQRSIVIDTILNGYCRECLRLEGVETEKDCQCWNDE